jgi:hypothetical protein
MIEKDSVIPQKSLFPAFGQGNAILCGIRFILFGNKK